jgi:hypothetical protein
LLAGVDTLYVLAPFLPRRTLIACVRSGSLSLFGLVYQVYATVRNASRGMPPSARDHAVARRRTWIVRSHAPPRKHSCSRGWAVARAAVHDLASGGVRDRALHHSAPGGRRAQRAAVLRHDHRPAVRSASSRPHAPLIPARRRLAIVGIDAAVLAGTLTLEALSVMHFVRIWRGASRHGGSRAIMDTSIRIGAFALLLTVALVLALIAIVMPGNAAPDLVMSTSAWALGPCRAPRSRTHSGHVHLLHLWHAARYYPLVGALAAPPGVWPGGGRGDEYACDMLKRAH